MPITITLDDDLAIRLKEEAEARQVSVQQWAVQVLNGSREFLDQSEAWRELSTRRFELIHRRYQGGLSEAEAAELDELQSIADRWLEPMDHRRLEHLASYEELAQRLTGQSDA
jgi:hypothetical protein